ncbi:Fc.00g013810.m01.CDS01 [Cosmosporella sp. VM-42]
MASSSAIRFVTGTKKAPLGSLHLQLHVKPGASKNREGVIGITDDAIELCVAAQAREGEANKAVVQVLSSILGIPKSRLQLTHGMKSRDKTVVLGDIKGDGEEYAKSIREVLEKAVE